MYVREHQRSSCSSSPPFDAGQAFGKTQLVQVAEANARLPDQNSFLIVLDSF